MKNKKYLGMLGLGCAALLLTGCGSGKELKCTMDMSDQMAGLGTMKAEIVVDYDSKGETPEKATMKMVVEITSEDVTDEMVDSLEDSLKTTCDDEDANYESCEVKRDGRKITLEATGKAEDMEDAEIEADQTLEEAKKEMEEAGFTCE